MKIKIIFLILILILIPNIYAQVREIESRSYFKQGEFEVNFSTNLGAGFSTSTVSIVHSEVQYSSPAEYSDRPFIFLISTAVGVCVIDGLSVEPEFDINFITDAEISTSILINASYNFNIPRKSTYPFIKVGYGFSNYISDNYYYGYPYGSTNNSMDTRVINAGVGLKLIYTSGAAMKLELNYKHYSYSNSYSYSDQYYQTSSESSTDVDALTFSIGYSILL
ncbi:MAG: hypothetical protein OQJ78_04135 [Ignavibacteriaceae bacterium]|nr:hypothetical protein [Ignavibacteriaceae bacterium]